MVPRKTWFPRKMLARSRNSEAFVMGLEISFSGDFVSWRLEVSVSNFNQDLAVSQSLEINNLYPSTVPVQISIF